MTHTAPLLPDWLRVVWILALCAVAAVHLRHVRLMSGQRRFWHVGHVLMAGGMAYMYLPHSAHQVPQWTGTAVYATAAGGAVVVAAALGIRDGVINPLWSLITVEMLVMTYMFLPMNARSSLLSYLLAGYLAGIGVLWALGRLDRHYRPSHSGHTVRASARSTASALRVSLVTMAGAMAYMLLAM